MKLQDDGADKKLHGLFLEREMQEFAPKDLQMKVVPPSGTVIAGENPEQKETCGSQGWCPREEISQTKVECEEKGGSGAGKVAHESKRIAVFILKEALWDQYRTAGEEFLNKEPGKQRK